MVISSSPEDGVAWSAIAAAPILLALLALAQGVRAEAPRSASPHPQRAVFSSYIDDLPVMPGLSENSLGYTVELPPGRVAEARLIGASGPAAVRSFYAATLPHLGWRRSADQPYVFHRGRERLTYLVEPRMGAATGVEVVFRITPDAAPATGGLRP